MLIAHVAQIPVLVRRIDIADQHPNQSLRIHPWHQRQIRRREVVSKSVRRIMGTETEYAVSALGMEHYNPVKLSFDVVGAAANEQTKHIRWDYRQERPSTDQDARMHVPAWCRGRR